MSKIKIRWNLIFYKKIKIISLQFLRYVLNETICQQILIILTNCFIYHICVKRTKKLQKKRRIEKEL